MIIYINIIYIYICIIPIYNFPIIPIYLLYIAAASDEMCKRIKFEGPRKQYIRLSKEELFFNLRGTFSVCRMQRLNDFPGNENCY